jgi:hypothetical protein
MELSKALNMANEIESFRRFFFALKGEKFLKDVKELEPAIRKKAEEAGTDNLIIAMLPVWKDMSENHTDPGFLIAVTAQIIHDDNKKINEADVSVKQE